jgi:hypothetical protein
VTFYARHYSSYQIEKRASDAVLCKLQKRRRSLKKSDPEDQEFPLSPSCSRQLDDVSEGSGTPSPDTIPSAIPAPSIPSTVPCTMQFNYEMAGHGLSPSRHKGALGHELASSCVWKRPAHLILMCQRSVATPKGRPVAKKPSSVPCARRGRTANAASPVSAVNEVIRPPQLAADASAMALASSGDCGAVTGVLFMKKLLLQKRLEQLQKEKAASAASSVHSGNTE